MVETKYNRPPFSQIPLFQDILRLANGIEAAMTEALKTPAPAGGEDLDAMLEEEDAGNPAVASVAMLGFSEGSVATTAPGKRKKPQAKAATATKERTAPASGASAPIPIQAPTAEAAETMSQAGSSKKTKKNAAHEEALDSMDADMKRVALRHLNTGKGTSVKCLSLLQVPVFFGSIKNEVKNLTHCLPSVPFLVVRKIRKLSSE